APVEAEPADVGLDRVEVLLLLLDRGRVVEPEVAPAAELGRDPEVQADRLGMADVEVAVGLGREAGNRGGDPSGGDVGRDDLADEVAPLGRGWGLGDHARAPSTWTGGVAAHADGRTTLPEGVGWRARIRTWNPLIQSQVLYR